MSHILVVDDDIHIGNLLQEALEAEGCELLSAHERDESLESYFVNLVGGGSHD